MALKLMVLLLVLKLFAVTVSYASGNAGGIFGPSLFIGAMLGGIVGTVAQKVSPGHVAAPGAYALVGMGTAFAGIVRAPMTSVVMIFETTRDYAVIVPLMISNLVSLFISSRLQPKPIYEVLAEQDGIHLPTAETRSQDGQRRVVRAMRAVTESLEVSLTVQAAIEKAEGSASQSWLVVDKQRLQGVVRLEMLKKAVEDGNAAETLAKLVDGHFPHVHVDQPLIWMCCLWSAERMCTDWRAWSLYEMSSAFTGLAAPSVRPERFSPVMDKCRSLVRNWVLGR
jgi:CIC family chloride channel protein